MGLKFMHLHSPGFSHYILLSYKGRRWGRAAVSAIPELTVQVPRSISIDKAISLSNISL